MYTSVEERLVRSSDLSGVRWVGRQNDPVSNGWAR
jgi:hypothetical protein